MKIHKIKYVRFLRLESNFHYNFLEDDPWFKYQEQNGFQLSSDSSCRRSGVGSCCCMSAICIVSEQRHPDAGTWACGPSVTLTVEEPSFEVKDVVQSLKCKNKGWLVNGMEYCFCDP